MSAKRQALGRGLGALLSGSDMLVNPVNKENISSSLPPPSPQEVIVEGANAVIGAIAAIPLKLIEVNPFQPRTVFLPEQLEELAASIKVSGLIQPITVRKIGEKYQLISGERRFRAAKIANLTDIPAYIRMVNDNEMLEMALVENIQRENLNAIDVALSYQALLDTCQYNQDKLSERLGKNRSTVTNYLRLLKLPAEVQLALKDDKISMGHARAIITVESAGKQVDIVRSIIDKGLSVRQVEEVVRNLSKDKSESKSKSKKSQNEDVCIEEKKSLAQKLNTAVELKVNKA
ncbi:MAG: ParB/RepB/Spo0J family partition protein, partial [Bacteroidales bacterium]